jgi:hypothetical protein
MEDSESVCGTLRRSASDSNEETSDDGETDSTSTEGKSGPSLPIEGAEAVPIDPNTLASLHGVIKSLRNSASDTHKFTYLLILAKILNQ